MSTLGYLLGDNLRARSGSYIDQLSNQLAGFSLIKKYFTFPQFHAL